MSPETRNFFKKEWEKNKEQNRKDREELGPFWKDTVRTAIIVILGLGTWTIAAELTNPSHDFGNNPQEKQVSQMIEDVLDLPNK